MSRIRRAGSWIALLMVVGSLSGTAVENTGGIFGLGSSARAHGLGGAYMAVADDEGAVVHSPAALGWIDGFGVTSLLARQFGDVTFGAITAATRFVGAAILLLDSGPIETSDGLVRYASQGFVGSVGLPLGPLGIGARWRYVRVSSPMEGSGWSLDPAVTIRRGGICVAALWEGAWSSPVAYDTAREDAWEPRLRLGVAATFAPAPEVQWTGTLEVTGFLSPRWDVGAGIEAWIGGLGARVGFDGMGPTFGLSVRFEVLEIDWAYLTRADLGDSHRVALTIRF